MKSVLLLISLSVYSFTVLAQRVETGTRIINCSDMPDGVYTSVKRRCPVPDHDVTDRLNRTVYQRFEVAEHNYQNVALGTSREEAKRLCSAYHESVNDIGKWRLPTQRELMIIWILRPALANNAAASGFAPLDQTDSNSSAYYSATKNAGVGFRVNSTTDKTPNVAQSSGNGGISDISSNLVRCIRDLDIE